MEAREASRLTIVTLGRLTARHSSPEDWRLLVLEERLKRADQIGVMRGGVTVYQAAEEVPELRALFDEVEFAADASRRVRTPSPLEAEPAVAEETPPQQEEDTPPPPDPPPPTKPRTARAKPQPKRASPSTSKDAEPEEPPLEEKPPAPSLRDVATGLPLASPPFRRAARSRSRVPGWAWAAGVFAALLIVGVLLNREPDTGGGEEDAGVQAATPVTAYVSRETRVRSMPQSEGNTPLAALGRGQVLMGVWETGGDGRSRWLRLTSGPFAGSYVWGANLTDIPPEPLATAFEAELEVSQPTELRVAPREDAVVLDNLLPGQPVTVSGRLASGWFEVLLKSGGVGYLPPYALEAPAEEVETDPYASPETTPPAPSNASPEPPPARSPDPTGPPETYAPPPPAAEPQPSPPSPPPPSYVRGAVALRQPTQEQIDRATPMRAVRRNLSGKGRIDCAIDEAGRLHDCLAVAEDPPGSGFGAAAVSLSRHFQIGSTDGDGAPVAGRRIKLGINFNTAE